MGIYSDDPQRSFTWTNRIGWTAPISGFEDLEEQLLIDGNRLAFLGGVVARVMSSLGVQGMEEALDRLDHQIGRSEPGSPAGQAHLQLQVWLREYQDMNSAPTAATPVESVEHTS